MPDAISGISWEAVGSIAELIGALGVVASLIYLAVQVRQNTRSLKAATYESLAQATASSNALLIADPDIARIVEAGSASAMLDKEDAPRFAAYLRMTFRRYDSIYLHFRQKTLPGDAWNAYWNSFRNILPSPNVQAFWRKHQSDYTVEFQLLVNNELSVLAEKESVGFNRRLD